MPLRKKSPTEKATFVFKGTIKKLKSATMKEAPVDANTAVVTVNQIVEAPPDLAGYGGQDITVRLSGTRKVSVGQQLIFNAVSWLYGESIAVRSLNEEPVQDSHSAMLSTGGDPVERRLQRERQEHFDDADIVISGTVVAVRLPSEEAPAKKTAAALGSPRRKPISEHDPNWREAVVEVDDVLKGKHRKKQVIVRFPASTDVMWHNAPKFHTGQQGQFMLHEAKSEKRAAASKKGAAVVAESGAEAETYEALDPLDFQPL
ncbi:MAG: copper resistance protein [Blastocatellia bacterium]|jgi:hypothetical protein|nr:copper resistance protein [Blastocatellia bacterium]